MFPDSHLQPAPHSALYPKHSYAASLAYENGHSLYDAITSRDWNGNGGGNESNDGFMSDWETERLIQSVK